MTLPAAYAGSTVPPLSALQKLLTASADSSSTGRNLALQIAHNLRYQHNWTELHLHALQLPEQTFYALSGQPPERLYVHPDEQIDLLQRQKKLGKTGLPKLEPELEWVVPSHLRERWTLRRFGDVFDSIDIEPVLSSEASVIDFESGTVTARSHSGVPQSNNPWRTTKRILLATLDDDSTVVYYIVHDGVVKPRQN